MHVYMHLSLRFHNKRLEEAAALGRKEDVQ